MMGAVADGGWQWNDAWIFAAAVIAERLERDRAAAAGLPHVGASLADLLSAAAFLNRTVPSRSDLRRAVRRLTGAGLLTVDEDLVEVSPAGQQLWRNRPTSGLSSAVLTVQAQLNRAAPEPVEHEWELDEAAWATALREYAGRQRTG